MIESMMNLISPGPFSKDAMDLYVGWIRRARRSFQYDPHYVDFVSNTNGGRCSPPIELEPFGPIEHFLNFVDADDDTVPVEIRELNVEAYHSAIYGQIDRTLVPIAITPFGDVYCFNEENEIVVWIHDEPRETRVKPIAHDFSKFLRQIESL